MNWLNIICDALAVAVLAPIIAVIVAASAIYLWHRVAHWLDFNSYNRITWRRHPDGVRMTAHQCPHCGKVDHIHPIASSYRHRVRL